MILQLSEFSQTSVQLTVCGPGGCVDPGLCPHANSSSCQHWPLGWP